MSDQTTRVLTTYILFGPGGIMFKPRPGNRLRLIEEPIPAEEIPFDRKKGQPTKPGPSS